MEMTIKTATCHLTQRGVLRISGEDAASFLQGLLSNDITLCHPGQPLYAGFLSPQGKFLYDMIVVADHDAYWLDCELSRADDLLKSIATHKLRARVSMENVSNDKDVWSLHGADTSPGSEWFWDPRHRDLGYRSLLDKGKKPNVDVVMSHMDYDRKRIRLTVPDGSRDLEIGKSNLLEGNFDKLNGISWDKGCYRGQELTARLRYRGLVKKRLFTVRVEGPVPEPGTLLTMDGIDYGIMRSHATDLGLALLDVKIAEEAMVSHRSLKTNVGHLFVLDSSAAHA